jgi:hypothetical protein
MRTFSVVAALIWVVLAPNADAQSSAPRDMCPETSSGLSEAIDNNRLRASGAEKLNCTQKQFLKSYAAKLAEPLEDLENFKDLVNAIDPSSCNLLCRQGLAPKFWLNGPATVVDLIRYVFTNTCYGVGIHRTQALADLSQLLGDLHEDAKARTGSQRTFAQLLGGISVASKDRLFIRGELGDMLVESKINAPSLRDLWVHSSESRQDAAARQFPELTRSAPHHRKTPSIPPSEQAARVEACATSFVNRKAQKSR